MTVNTDSENLILNRSRIESSRSSGHPRSIGCCLENEYLTQRVIAIHRASKGTDGYPRIRAASHREGIRCSKNRVARLKKTAGLKGISRRKRPGVRPWKSGSGVAPDLVKRRFLAEAPNQLWVADITQHETGDGRLYIAGVVDVFSRQVVGWAMGERATADLVISALNMAVQARRPPSGTIHHSDQGAQYTSFKYGARLRQAGIIGSMGSSGDAYDNALSESFWASLQTELLDRRVWSSREQLRTAVFEYIEVFYNRQRLHSALGYRSPSEFEQQWEAMQSETENPEATLPLVATVSG